MSKPDDVAAQNSRAIFARCLLRHSITCYGACLFSLVFIMPSEVWLVKVLAMVLIWTDEVSLSHATLGFIIVKAVYGLAAFDGLRAWYVMPKPKGAAIWAVGIISALALGAAIYGCFFLPTLAR